MTVLAEVGHYRRDFPVGIERLFENALDWEHLPHLHGNSFRTIEIIAAKRDGWRARATLSDGQAITIQLQVGAEGWVTRTEASGTLLSEIRTRAESIGRERSRVSVSFHLPAQSEDRDAVAGMAYQRLYARLYDEDERMMVARAEAKRRPAAERHARREVTLSDGRSFEIPLYCPHQGLPLDAGPDDNGVLTCPWHGYRFDVATGQCVSGQAVAGACDRGTDAASAFAVRLGEVAIPGAATSPITALRQVRATKVFR